MKSISGVKYMDSDISFMSLLVNFLSKTNLNDPPTHTQSTSLTSQVPIMTELMYSLAYSSKLL